MHEIVFFYPTGHEAHSKPYHPERPARVEAIKTKLEANGLLENALSLEPQLIPDDVISSIHPHPYLETIREASEKGLSLDADTYINSDSFRLAQNSVGGAVAVARSVWEKEAKRGFALTRPPGHHATPTKPMGFCLINNIAVSAEHLIRIGGAKRLAIVDIDLHHGNGTQDIFYKRDDVLFVSIHQWPLYPGTGKISEVGSEKGQGFNVNIPLPPESGDKAFETCIREIVLPLVTQYKPEMLLVSAGFDAHWRDPLGNLLASTNIYGKTISELSNWSDMNCDGRIALFLEGGYDIEAGADSAFAATQAMLGLNWHDPLGPSREIETNDWIDTVAQVKKIWNL